MMANCRDRLPTQDEIIWAAGFFDGEGNIYLSKLGVLELSVGQMVAAPLLLMRECWGGSIGAPRKDGLLNWRVRGERTAEFISDVWPYLRVKQQQIRKETAKWQPQWTKVRAARERMLQVMTAN